MQFLQKAVAIDLNYWDAQNNLGFAYLQMAQPQSAELAFEQAARIDPRNPFAFANLSVAALDRN